MALLKEEQQKLIAARIDGLPALMESKSVVVSQLTILIKGRHALLAVDGFEASERGMRDWIATRDSAQIDAEWNGLLAVSAEAKELNRVNGMLIGRHLVRTNTELNILQGKPQHTSLYGANGQSTGKGIGRGLAIG
ncbi:hypothetical protein GCM10022212_37190 [Actimicrobium antarcticum]|uniref:Flagellar protein FlgN n=1 Tax=Actimicrobium antarcticum TaxID=1051899 RepID=A0ABP7U1K5_9BURK